MAAYLTDITELEPRRDDAAGRWIIRWRDDYTGKLYQIYVNGALAAQTRNVGASKELAIMAAGSFLAQVIAIDPGEAGRDFAALLADQADRGERVRLSWPRDPRRFAPSDAAQVYSDGGTGAMDETNPLNREPIAVFPPGTRTWGQFAGGHGTYRHGWGGLGLPWGRRRHGLGPHGVGLDAVDWTTSALTPGYHRFMVRITDRAGNVSAAVETGALVDCHPAPPRRLAAADYDAPAQVLTLEVAR